LSYGGHLPTETLQEFERKTDALILQAYGFSEAGPLVTSNRINRDRKPGSVGLPLVGVEIKVVNEEGQIVRPNENGEVYIKSPSLTHGYFNKPEETQKHLHDGWFASGDIGYLDDDHYLFLQERKEDIIIKGGFHIFPSEVERVLLNHPAVAEVAVVAIPDSVQGHEVKAFVVLKSDQTISKEELTDFCRQELPVYKLPKFIEITVALPKSATGRVLKEVLRAGPPAAPTEKLIS
jgi:long-chain acyl-CoA synthetase